MESVSKEQNSFEYVYYCIGGQLRNVFSARTFRAKSYFGKTKVNNIFLPIYALYIQNTLDQVYFKEDRLLV